MKRLFPIIPFLAGSLLSHASDWNTLLLELDQHHDQLKKEIQKAEELQITTDYAEVSSNVITIFRKAATHDKNNPERVREIFSTLWYYDKIDPKYTDQLPEFELRDCIEVAKHATAELQKEIRNEASRFRPPNLSQGTVELTNGIYTIDGIPYFPSSLVWTPKLEQELDSFGRLGGAYYQVSNIREDGSPTRHLQTQLQRIEEQHTFNLAPFSLLTGHNLAGWLEEMDPTIHYGGRNFVQYDIDNPIVRDYIKKLYKAYVPPIIEASGDTPSLHLLANEPHFATHKKGWKNNGLSDHTINKFHNWLRLKYRSVKQLNLHHGEHYKRFDDVLFTLEMPPDDRQIDPTLRGSALYYDWIRFNHDRVNDWFTFLKEQCHANDPKKSPISIKVLGYSLSRDTRDGGMDMEYLTKLQGIMGADLRCMPLGANVYGKHEEGDDPKTAWQTHFAYEWSEQSMFLDFSKSLCPEKLFYDSEWHGFGTVSWRHFNMDRNYVRSALWLAFSHGMGMINPWVWGRNEDGALSPKTDHIGELSTQPIAVDAYARTMKELNVYASQLQTLSRPERTFMIYYCEEAAIQDETYTEGLKSVYEALKLLNWTCGFTTPSEIHKLDPQSQVVIVSPTSYIKDNSLTQLRAFSQAGGITILTGADQSFKKTELGAERNESNRFAFKALPHGNFLELIDTFRSSLQDLQPEPKVPFRILDETGEESFGVIVQQRRDPKIKRQLILLNNISKEPRTVQLHPHAGQSKKFVNMMTMRRTSSEFEMQPNEVLLLLYEQ